MKGTFLQVFQAFKYWTINGFRHSTFIPEVSSCACFLHISTGSGNNITHISSWNEKKINRYSESMFVGLICKQCNLKSVRSCICQIWQALVKHCRNNSRQVSVTRSHIPDGMGQALVKRFALTLRWFLSIYFNWSDFWNKIKKIHCVFKD